MGVFRTVQTRLQCTRCGASFACDVQFKTDNDRSMPVHQVGDHVEDIEPGVYEGLADAFCERCQLRWIDDEKRAHFERLAEEVDAGLVIVRSADAPPLSGGDVRALADARDRGGWPNFPARLIEAEVALWVGSDLIGPGEPSSDAAYRSWSTAHEEAVAQRLRELGWQHGAEQFLEVSVRVSADKRIQVGQT